MAKSNVLQMGKYQRQQVFSLLANLCFEPLDPEFARQGVPEVPHNRLPEMGEYRLTPRLLELGGMPAEACVLRAIEALVAQGLAPTFQAVEDALPYALEDNVAKWSTSI